MGTLFKYGACEWNPHSCRENLISYIKFCLARIQLIARNKKKTLQLLRF